MSNPHYLLYKTTVYVHRPLRPIHLKSSSTSYMWLQFHIIFNYFSPSHSWLFSLPLTIQIFHIFGFMYSWLIASFVLLSQSKKVTWNLKILLHLSFCGSGCVLSIITYRRNFLLRLNSYKQHSKLSTRCYFWSTEQTWHPIWTQLYDGQMFMQNSAYTAFWNL